MTAVKIPARSIGFKPDPKLIGQLKRIADHFRFVATRIGEKGCHVRLEAADNLWAIEEAIKHLSGYAS